MRRNDSLLWIAACGLASMPLACSAPPPATARPPAAASPAPVPTAIPAGRMGLYFRAAAAIADTRPAVDRVLDLDDVGDANVAAERYSLARKEAWLKKNAPGFQLFQTALRTPLSPMGRKKSKSLSYLPLRQLARCKLVESHAREMRGDWAGAIRSRLDIVEMGADIGTGGPVDSALVAHAIQSQARYDDIWRLTERLTLPQTRAALVRLEGLYDHRLRVAQTLEAAKRAGLDEIHDVLRQPDWKNPQNWLSLSPAQSAGLAALTPDTFLKHYAAAMDRRIKLAGLPYKKALAERETPVNAMIDVYAPDYAPLASNFARTDTGNAVWLVATALHGYKLEHGAFPRDLRALVPRFLRRIPADAYDGTAPLRYKKTGDSYLLWGIGPDGIDDGGRAIRWTRAPKTYPGSVPVLPYQAPNAKGDFVAGKNR